LEVEEFAFNRWGQGAIWATGRVDHWDQEQEMAVEYANVRHGRFRRVFEEVGMDWLKV
jgi:hypothetical protein